MSIFTNVRNYRGWDGKALGYHTIGRALCNRCHEMKNKFYRKSKSVPNCEGFVNQK